MCSYNNLIAKSDGTSLRDHTLDSVCILNILLNSDKKLLENRAKLLNINISDFLSKLRKATFFHDFGKSSNYWQCKVNNIVNLQRGHDEYEIVNSEYKANNIFNLPPHAVYSGFFLSHIKDSNNLIPLLLSTSHHSLLTEHSFGNNLIKKIDFEEKYLSNFAKLNNYSLDCFDSLSNYIKNMKRFAIESQRTECREIQNLEKEINILFKAEYCLSLSYLTISDGLASKFEENNDIINQLEILNRYPSSETVINTIGDFTKKRNLTSIQSAVSCSINSMDINHLVKPILIEAPCGEGKTLASLLFAEKLFKNNLINKVIFALPTQITSNNMFFEFKEEYNVPEEWIGIYHSEVFNFLMSINDNNEFNPHLEKYQNLIYSKPFNISTIDHLLLSLVNGFKYAPRAFGNICNSLVIIDELHYYDSYTISLIEVLCEILRLLKIPHILMSATMPSYIKNKFNDEEYLKIQSSGRDFNNIEKNPFDFSFHNNLIYVDGSFSQEFLDVLNENINKNLGIIVNTIDISQKLYDDIKELYPEKQILLYNAQFMKCHRPIKEKLLKYFSNIIFDNSNNVEKEELLNFNFNPNEKFIFIGTQVAEISLNVSFDVMISQLAPLDALIQRGGRLHRKMTFNNSKECDCLQCQKLDENHKYILHVFDTNDYCYPYYTEKDIGEDNFKRIIINNTRSVLLNNSKFTFKNSIKMINDVYNFNSFDKDSENIKEAYKKIITEDLIFGKNPSFSEEKGGQLRIQTRNIAVPRTIVLPDSFYYKNKYISAKDFIEKMYKKYNYKGKLTSEGLSEIMKYMINVSHQFYIKNSKSEPLSKGDYYFKVINLDYTFERGLFKNEANQLKN